MDFSPDELMRMLSGQPLMSAFSCINMSCSCATTRLIQLRMFGTRECSVANKIAKEADTGDDDMDFKLAIVDNFEQQRGAKDWQVVMWVWNCVNGLSESLIDVGGLIFVDNTTTRFILIESSPSCDWRLQEWETKAKYLANQLFCLAKYIGYKPKSVRYLALPMCRKPLMPEGLLGTKVPVSLDEDGFGEVNGSNFIPSLPIRLIQGIDQIINKDKFAKSSVAQYREEAGGLEALTASVVQTVPDDPILKLMKDTAPRVDYQISEEPRVKRSNKKMFARTCG